MVSLLILSQFVILYVLVIVTRQLPLMFRLFLGLIVTWPVLSLYVQIELPSGIPDVLYSRAYVGALLLCIAMSAVVARRYRRSAATKRLAADDPARSAAWMGATRSAPLKSEPSAGEPEHRSSTAPGALAGRLEGSMEQAQVSSNATQPVSGYQGQVSGIPFLLWAYVGLMGLSVVSSLATGAAGSAVVAGYVDATLLPLAIYYLTRRYVDSRQRLAWLLAAITASALIICITGLYERALDLTDSPFPIAPINEDGDTRWLGVPGGRAAGVLENPAIYGGVMGMGMLCCLTFFGHCTKRSNRLLFGSVALVLAYGVFVSYTRSAWASVAIALFVVQFFLNGLWKVSLPLLVFAVLVIALMWGGLKQNDLVQTRVLETENVTGRIERLSWSWDRFLERPILGRGIGALDDMMHQVYQEDFDTSHNTYLTMLVENGVVRFALFMAVVIGWFAKAAFVLRSRLRGQFEYSVVAAMIGFMLIWLLSGMSIELKLFPYFAALFWMAGAIIERVTAHMESSEASAVYGVTRLTRASRSRVASRLGESGVPLHG